MTHLGRLLRTLAFLVVAFSLAGFCFYSVRVSTIQGPAAGIRADGIVVLTGDQGRLTAGVQLLQDGRAPHLLITGVHPSVTMSDIRANTSLSSAEFDCCVQLGHEANDTVGNARETAQWVRSNGFQTLIIVTSDYHLPRSLIEMEMAMPGVDFIPFPVRTVPPWSNPRAARLWVQEYAKYTTVWLGQVLFSPADTAA